MLVFDRTVTGRSALDAGLRIDDVGDQARALVELDQRDVVGELLP